MAKAKKKPKLTGLQKKWAEAFIVLGLRNGTEAARIAGYKGSDNTLAVQAYHNLRNPKILAYLEERLTELCIPANELLLELSMVATSTLGDVVDIDQDGMIQLKESALKSHGHLFKSVRISEGKTKIVHIQLHDKLRALQLLGQYLGLFKGDGVNIFNLGDPSKPYSDQELADMVTGILNKSKNEK